MDTQNTNTIYLVRHGENLANITKEFSYKLVDYPLTAKGVRQAQQTAEFFRDKNIQEIYSSPLKRAVETANIIAETLGLDVTLMEEFREVNVGELEGQPPNAENWAFHNRIVDAWYNGDHATTFPGGENFLMVMQRVRSGLQVVTQGKTRKNILIVGHAGIFTAAVKGICPQVNDSVSLSSIHNCSITRLELRANDNDVVGDLQYWAHCQHLSGEAAELIPGVPQFDAEETGKPA